MKIEQNRPLDDPDGLGHGSNIPVPQKSLEHWKEISTWAQILAVTNFLSAAIQLGNFFTTLSKLRFLFYLNPVLGNNITLAGILLFLVFFVFTLLIGWQLWRLSSYLKHTVTRLDPDDLDLAYYYQFRYFKTLGWMTIGMLAMTLVGALMIMYSRV